MAIALVSAGSVATGTTSASPSFGQSTTAGNLLILMFCGDTINSPTISGWTKAGSSDARAGIYYKANCGAGESAPTVTISQNGFTAAVLLEFSGADTSAPFDKAGHTATSATSSPMSVTATAADTASGELVVSAASWNLTKAGTGTTVDTYNNGATANDVGNNDSTSQVSHYRFSYGFTTGNSSADNLSETQSSMNISSGHAAIASFLVASAGPPVVIPDVYFAITRT